MTNHATRSSEVGRGLVARARPAEAALAAVLANGRRHPGYDVAMEKVILVTGASGFIGSHLARALVDAGYRVRAMTRRPETYGGLVKL